MKRYRNIWAFFCLCALVNLLPVLAQDATMEFPALQAALSDKKADAVLAALTEITDETEKQAAEQLVLVEARALVFQNDLDTASGFAEAVLLSNFLNNDAQELYLSIEQERTTRAALEERRKAEAEAQERLRLEKEAEQRRAEEAEQLRLKIEEDKIREQQFLQSVRQVGLGNISLTLALSPGAALLYSSPFADEYSGNSGMKTAVGASTEVGAAFNHPYLYAGIKARYGMTYLPLDEAEARSLIAARLSLGSPLIGIPLRLSAGYMNFSFQKSDGGAADTVLFTAMSSPTIGLSIENLSLGSAIDITGSAQWIIASREDTLIDNALTAEISGRYKFPEYKKLRFFIAPSVDTVIILADSRQEWTYNINLFAGVLLNEYR